jgi:hypothetical protein
VEAVVGSIVAPHDDIHVLASDLSKGQSNARSEGHMDLPNWRLILETE